MLGLGFLGFRLSVSVLRFRGQRCLSLGLRLHVETKGTSNSLRFYPSQILYPKGGHLAPNWGLESTLNPKPLKPIALEGNRPKTRVLGFPKQLGAYSPP